MDLERYHGLRAILQQWRLRLAESIRGWMGGTHWVLDENNKERPMISNLALLLLPRSSQLFQRL